MSAGVGPPRDIGVAKEEAHEPADINKTAVKSPTRGDFFTFRQLKALAAIIIISAGGLVSIEDFAFVIFSIIYMYFISKFAFPATHLVEGDKVGSTGAAPHVFLLASQVFMEGLASAGGFLLPIRVFVPVLFNTRRIFTIVEWLRVEISKVGGGGIRRQFKEGPMF
ncbi:hypothetical protein Adt_03057 [Abeliophyllum distichum]|uniref:DUF7733 domain-containing protein n=1 Tax=Abeliophyllum distichum TaxID=126358 RepID=A0ABD1VXG8_9LAMI